MKTKIVVATMALIAVFSGSAQAADFTQIGNLSVIFSIIVFLASLACLTMAIKLGSLVKGGALAKGCQVWIISFVTLAIGQFFVLAEKFAIFAIGFDIAGLLVVITVILWFVGLMQTRRVLG